MVKYTLTEEALQYLLNIKAGFELIEVKGESVTHLYKCTKSLEKVFEGISKEETPNKTNEDE